MLTLDAFASGQLRGRTAVTGLERVAAQMDLKPLARRALVLFFFCLDFVLTGRKVGLDLASISYSTGLRMDRSFTPRMTSLCTPAEFSKQILDVPVLERDVWWNDVLGLDVLPEDSSELPQGCVPYMPAPVDALLRIVKYVPVTQHDTFVDVGCGVGRAALFVRMLTGARVVGVDVQSHMVSEARKVAVRLETAAFEFVVSDACEHFVAGSVYFLYCPFGGDRVNKFLSNLRAHALSRKISIACLDMQLPTCEWLLESHSWSDLRLYESVPKQLDRARFMQPVPCAKRG